MILFHTKPYSAHTLKYIFNKNSMIAGLFTALCRGNTILTPKASF